MKDTEVRKFIEKCIAKVSDRMSAKELLMDPFLLDEDSGSLGRSLNQYSSGQVYTSLFTVCIETNPSFVTDAVCTDGNANRFDDENHHEDSLLEGSRDFMVQGQRKDHNTIFLKLRIVDSSGSCFLFISPILF